MSRPQNKKTNQTQDFKNLNKIIKITCWALVQCVALTGPYMLTLLYTHWDPHTHLYIYTHTETHTDLCTYTHTKTHTHWNTPNYTHTHTHTDPQRPIRMWLGKMSSYNNIMMLEQRNNLRLFVLYRRWRSPRSWCPNTDTAVPSSCTRSNLPKHSSIQISSSLLSSFYENVVIKITQPLKSFRTCHMFIHAFSRFSGSLFVLFILK